MALRQSYTDDISYMVSDADIGRWYSQYSAVAVRFSVTNALITLFVGFASAVATVVNIMQSAMAVLKIDFIVVCVNVCYYRYANYG